MRIIHCFIVIKYISCDQCGKILFKLQLLYLTSEVTFGFTYRQMLAHQCCTSVAPVLHQCSTSVAPVLRT